MTEKDIENEKLQNVPRNADEKLQNIPQNPDENLESKNKELTYVTANTRILGLLSWETTWFVFMRTEVTNFTGLLLA
jgi:hypothetical protein